MAVASRGAALSALRSLINHDPVPASTLLQRPYLPEGIDPVADSVRLAPESLIGGYGNEARYLLPAEDEATRVAVAGPPVHVLADRPSIDSRMVRTYVSSSIDLTMQGGTTSGVVYPLAVCDLATAFRFRNVGGASAGAIAAALTAAAELGRSERVRHPEATPTPEATTDPDPVADPAVGQPAASPATTVRRGFVGLTDIIGWLTQIRPGDPERDEFRLAQLFRAPDGTRDIFRILVAAMRQRTWSLPLIMLSAFGWPTRIAAAVIIAATVVGTGWVCSRFVGREFSGLGLVGWGLLGYLSFLATVIGAVLLVQGLLVLVHDRRTFVPAPDWVLRLRNASSRFVPSPTRPNLLLAPGFLLPVLGLTVVWQQPAPYWAGWLVGLAGTLTLIAVLLGSALRMVGRFRDVSYGLLAGDTPHRSRDLLDVLAGAPRATVGPSVVPWLAASLNQLAGLSPQVVMRFGHLWSGLDYAAPGAGGDGATLAGLRATSEDPDRRLVNLELMTTDITRQRPYRFPLPEVGVDDPERLWLCLDELRDASGSGPFGEDVLAVLGEGKSRRVADVTGTVRTLHPLPDPWDLPVVFAVRISMALPGLFQAIRMYRILPATPVHDDFGRQLRGKGLPTAGEGPEVGGEPATEVAEELWFSDGGITSNFPVHFFDASLPRWPTVSLNLGKHPDTSPHQDVSLPQDWDADAAVSKSLTRSGFSLVAGMFFTAMSWRDTMQSAMPGYRNRIAQVRTRPNEGGANLFMARELISSMALRGALAGARLRSRFADESQWNRFRWLRLRVAVGNLERLRALTGERRGFYADAFSGPAWLVDQEQRFTEHPAGGSVPWHEPAEGFWPKAPRMLNTFVDGHRPTGAEPNVMTTCVPGPEPVLRQVPRE